MHDREPELTDEQLASMSREKLDALRGDVTNDVIAIQSQLGNQQKPAPCGTRLMTWQEFNNWKMRAKSALKSKLAYLRRIKSVRKAVNEEAFSLNVLGGIRPAAAGLLRELLAYDFSRPVDEIVRSKMIQLAPLVLHANELPEFESRLRSWFANKDLDGIRGQPG